MKRIILSILLGLVVFTATISSQTMVFASSKVTTVDEFNDPMSKLPKVATFSVTSKDMVQGQPLALAQLSAVFGVKGGQDISPQLTWSGAPVETKSYAVTMYDIDAPTGAGFWHWAVVNIPANVTELSTDAGRDNGTGLPSGAFQLPNDARMARYIGAAPPAGHGPHRYYFTVYALDVENIGIAPDATPSLLGFMMSQHTLGRAVFMTTAEL